MRASQLKIFFLLGVFLLAGCETRHKQPQLETSPGIPLAECQLSAPGISRRLPARCGRFSVPEDRRNPGGRKIGLNIAVLPAVSRSPAPDPLFFIPGGPGEAATQTYLVIASAFERLNDKRDIVLLDQRGTGGSHPLNCTLLEEDENEAEQTSEEAKEAAQRSALQACLEGLDANPTLYTTSIAVEDLEAVRAALGYSQVNLYGASYGTRVALAYLRQYPGSVRTLTLDGIAAPDWTLGPSVAADAQRALDLLFDRCAAQESCATAFPNLRQDFSAIQAELRSQPVAVSLLHPITGQPTTLKLTTELFANTIHTLSYSPETATLLPLIIHTAAERDDYSLLAAQTLSRTGALNESISTGMRFSVVCAEDVPYYPPELENQGYMGDLFLNSMRKICSNWPIAKIPAGFREPVVSDKPVLLLSGEVDPVTPPANGEHAAQGLSHSLHLVAPGQGHINIYRGCIPTLATQFIESADPLSLDTSCVQNIIPAPFFVNFNGPVP